MRDLSRLLRPRSVAVVGGGTWCANVIRECRRIGFAGDLWPVHPRRDSVAEVPAFASVEDLPGVPDAAFVGVNRNATVEVVRALSAAGAGGAVCFASGFSEAAAEIEGAAGLQDQLVDAAGAMPILGPNCYGLLNLLDGAALWPDHHGGTRTARGVAIVTQSSNIAINLTMQRRALPLAYMVTAGNQAQMDLAGIGAALLEDDRVTALGLHVEGIDDPAGLEALARAAHAAGKPIVALKVGRSDGAQAATLSHTASLAGSAAGADALFDRLGIARVDGLSELIETLKILHFTGPLPATRIASMSCSGGEASLVADTAQAHGLSFPKLCAAQKAALRAALGPSVALANPLDYNTYIWGDRDAMARTFAAMLTPGIAMGAVVLDFPRSDRCAATEWDVVIDAAAEARARTGKPLALLSSLTDTMEEATALSIAERGLVPLCGLDEGLAAIAAAARCGAPVTEAPVLPPRVPARPVTLTEAEGKDLLAGQGLRVPHARRVTGAEQAVAAAREIGFPVVLKGEGIAHKTEAGAVRLDLREADAVRAAACAMPTDASLVEEMVTGAVAELLVGVVLDPAHGYVLTLAAGGTLTELLRDRVSLLVPASREAVEAALAGLRIAPVLDGWRGAAPAAREPVLDAVMAVQSFVTANHGALAEIEINPLLCGPRHAVAADILIRMGETT
ncbi:acetate--CoA ligase family protein [Pseudoponticoccus marisrubri]|uniref:Acyl-CoA synthetase n=1 Tax=Pseudoponticoccus marisrubri TaxID=1685382 RepID=A0A0W7WJG7_9RHOB|nr:acetate--CoA ligase family protein [Pseudoponticoccus marisrubri]KUF10764.1 acyl-CoA synthetase [Pseudoponticoccus marisrubri]